MRLGTTLAAVGLCLAVTGCNDPNRAIMNKEDMLAASGFKFVPANTPERQAAFSKLPPHQFSRHIKDGRVIYAYADPTICNCLYVGGQKAYGAYQARRFDKRIADEQAQAAADISMASWDWGPWGVGYPVGWPYYMD
ncbi:MAG: hypothetical protein KIS73_16995 [Enhydrobacter sp.]|nr:hypothetical protein [Enhydrobacter sp.]